MLDKIKKTLQEASDTMREQASQIGDSAREKSYKIIEEWLESIPKLEATGFEVTSFALEVALSPSVEIELKGKNEDFPPQRIEQILAHHKGNTVVQSVFSTLKMTYRLHRKVNAPIQDPLIIKIRIKLAPEIQIFIGEPIIQ